jgi:predicted Zn finger-like uncharacterized protein
MIIVCPQCKVRLKLPDEKMKPGGVRLRCVKCNTVFTHAAQADKKPGAGPSRAVRPSGSAAAPAAPSVRSDAEQKQRSRATGGPRTAPSKSQAAAKPARQEDGPEAETGGPSAEDVAKAQETYRRYGFMADGPERLEQQPFINMFPGAFAFPLKGGGPLMLGIGTIVITVTLFFSRYAFLAGILGYVFVGGFLASFMMRIVSQTADGEIDFPDWPDLADWWDDIVGPLFRLIAVTLISYLPLIIYYVLSMTSRGFSFLVAGGLILLGSLYQPMALIAMSIFRSAGALSPLYIIPAIGKVPADYAIACGGLLLIFTMKAVFHWINFIPLVGTLLGNLIMLYLLTVEMRLLGLLYYSNREKFGWI